MPKLNLLNGAVDTFMLPNSRVTVTMKHRASGRDHHEALQACLGEGYNPRQSYTRYLCYLAAAVMVSWDATAEDEEGKFEPIPISPQTLGAIADEHDYQMLLEETTKRVVLRGEQDEANFTTSSSASSPATNSRTRRNTRRSSTTST